MLGGCWADIELFESIKSENFPNKSITKKVSNFKKYYDNKFSNNIHQVDPLFIKSLHHLSFSAIYPLYFSYQSFSESNDSTLNWQSLPFSITPKGGLLPDNRVNRKTIQLNNMIDLSIKFIKHILQNLHNGERVKIVEFCAGSGFISLPLAFLYPTIDFILIDKKSFSLDIARTRISSAKLSNVKIVESDLLDYNESFDIGIALHACGSASDFSLQKCLNCQACFIICPCCIGKISPIRSSPLSKKLQESLCSQKFLHLVRAADFSHSINDSIDVNDPITIQRRISKAYIEEDRRLHALEFGYNAYITTMHPKGASPKDDIIIGWPKHSYLFKNFEKDEFENHILNFDDVAKSFGI